MTNRFITPKQLPTPFDAEVLGIFAEECNEAAIRASKAVRFGLDEVQPEQPFSNHQRLAHEIGDILCMVDLMLLWGIIGEHDIEKGKVHKRRQLETYMQNQPAGGLWKK